MSFLFLVVVGAVIFITGLLIYQASGLCMSTGG